MAREKMSRLNRASQFAPFDALKGFEEALRLKEYEHEKIEKSDLCEEKIKEISFTLFNIKKNDLVSILFYKDGHYIVKEGNIMPYLLEGYVDIYNNLNNKVRIELLDIFEIKII